METGIEPSPGTCISDVCQTVDQVQHNVGIAQWSRAGNFSLHQCPDQLLGPPNLLSNGYQGLFPCG
jgi:hypothetical protein